MGKTPQLTRPGATNTMGISPPRGRLVTCLCGVSLFLILWLGLPVYWSQGAGTWVYIPFLRAQAGADTHQPDRHPATDMGWPPPARGQLGYTTLETGLGMTGSSPVLTTRLGLAARIEKARLTFGLAVPLRVNVWEGAGPSFAFRTQDWQESSDFLGILRFLDYQTPSDPVHVTVGELSSITLGHGTITGQYYNQLGQNHRQTGAALSGAFTQGNIEAMMNSLTEPTTAGASLTIRPLAISGLARKTPAPFRELGVGVTVTGDNLADKRAQQAELLGGVFIYGVHLDLPMGLSRFPLTVTPYADFNWIWTMGTGLHAGTLVEAVFSKLHLDTSLKVEWQHSRGAYLPQYFGPMYELERLGVHRSGDGGARAGLNPKSHLLLHPHSTGGEHGLHVEGALGIANVVSLSTMFTHGFIRNESSLAVRAQLTNLGALHLGACYFRQGRPGAGLGSPVFLENNTMVMGEARLQITPALYLHFQGGRYWEMEGDRLANKGWDWTGGGGLRIWF